MLNRGVDRQKGCGKAAGIMKILHVVPGLRKNGGGVSESVPNSCRALRALGHEVGIAVCEPDSLSESALAAEREGVRIHRFGGNVEWKNPILLSWDLWRGLERIVCDYDVVHVRANWLFPVWWQPCSRTTRLRTESSFLRF